MCVQVGSECRSSARAISVEMTLTVTLCDVESSLVGGEDWWGRGEEGGGGRERTWRVDQVGESLVERTVRGCSYETRKHSPVARWPGRDVLCVRVVHDRESGRPSGTRTHPNEVSTNQIPEDTLYYLVPRLEDCQLESVVRRTHYDAPRDVVDVNDEGQKSRALSRKRAWRKVGSRSAPSRGDELRDKGPTKYGWRICPFPPFLLHKGTLSPFQA